MITNSEKILISIVLPVYNEEEAIKEVIEKIKEVMNKNNFNYEILVVDDASTDKTLEVVNDIKEVRVIKHSLNKGSGGSRKTGILHSKGDIIVMLDADGTYPAESIPELLKYFPEYDQVVGARTSEKGSLKFLRFPAKWIIRKLACFLSKTNIPDLNSGLRAFKRNVMLRFLYLIPDGFSCVTTMTLAFLCNGYQVKYVPIEYFKRIGKSKFHPVKDTYNYLLTVVRMITYFDPLKIFFPLSIILLLLGVVKSLIDLFFIVYMLQLSDIIIILASILLAAMGLLADLIVMQGKRQYYEILQKELLEENTIQKFRK